MFFVRMFATDVLLSRQLGRNPDAGRPSDSMSILTPDGRVLRLPDYSKAATPINLRKCEGYEIRAEALPPILRQNSDGILSVPRFAIRIARGERTVHHRRYAGDQATLTEASVAAVQWIRQHRLRLKLSYVCSMPLLVLWAICLAVAWYFEPVVRWISFLPLFVTVPIGWGFAPLRPKRATTASLAGFVWNRNDFCRGWLI